MKSKKSQRSWALPFFAILLTLAGLLYFSQDQAEEREGTRPELSDPHRVTVNGKVLTLDEPVYLIGDVIMVPLRELFEKAGAEVRFHPYREEAFVRLDDKLASVRIGQRHALIEKSPFRMSRPSMVIEGSMYVPLGFAEELL